MHIHVVKSAALAGNCLACRGLIAALHFRRVHCGSRHTLHVLQFCAVHAGRVHEMHNVRRVARVLCCHTSEL